MRRNQFPAATFLAWEAHRYNLRQTFQFSPCKCNSGYFKCMHHTERLVEWMLSSSRSAAENIFCFISFMCAVMSHSAQGDYSWVPGFAGFRPEEECELSLWTGTWGHAADVQKAAKPKWVLFAPSWCHSEVSPPVCCRTTSSNKSLLSIICTNWGRAPLVH